MEVDADRSDPGLSGSSAPAGPGILRTVLAAFVVLLPLVVGGVAWWWADRERDVAAAGRQADEDAVRAATIEVLNWASVDYRQLDEYFAKVKAGATGQFLDEFSQTEGTLRQGLRRNRSVQVPTIPEGGAGLLERTGDTARVVVAFDAVVTNRATKGEAQPRQYRMQVTLQKVDRQWLTSRLEFVG